MADKRRAATSVRPAAALVIGTSAVAALVAASPDTALLSGLVARPAPTVADLGVDGALVHLLAAGAWGCLAWLTAVTAVAALAQLPGAVGRTADRVARVVTPTLVRRAVETLLGVSALVGVMAPTAVSAEPSALAASTSTADPVSAVTAVSTGGTLRAVGEGGPVPTVAAVGAGPAHEGAGRTTAHAAPVPESADWPGRPRRVPTADWPSPSPAALPRGTPPPVAPGLVTAAPVRESADDAVVVRRGDTLWEIAARHLGAGATPAEVARAWPEWHRANRAVIGADPDLLLPGQRLVPPR